MARAAGSWPVNLREWRGFQAWMLTAAQEALEQQGCPSAKAWELARMMEVRPSLFGGNAVDLTLFGFGGEIDPEATREDLLWVAHLIAENVKALNKELGQDDPRDTVW